MPDLKICSQCYEAKLPNEFYVSKGASRSECKACTKEKNMAYQRKTKAWKHRYVDDEGRKTYLSEYYKNNRDKFANYRKRFLKANPDYHHDYYMKNKDK
jgi:GrpB-like predicted nucleotidyltransferase (UPF0157 family)